MRRPPREVPFPLLPFQFSFRTANSPASRHSRDRQLPPPRGEETWSKPTLRPGRRSAPFPSATQHARTSSGGVGTGAGGRAGGGWSLRWACRWDPGGAAHQRVRTTERPAGLGRHLGARGLFVVACSVCYRASAPLWRLWVAQWVGARDRKIWKINQYLVIPLANIRN